MPYARVAGREWATDDRNGMCNTEAAVSMSRKALSRYIYHSCVPPPFFLLPSERNIALTE